MTKIILDLCGGTGSWSKPYRDAGYDVYNITLPNWDVLDAYIDQEDFIKFPCSTERGTLTIPIQSIHGILAAPPCTMFSLARTNAKKPRDLAEGMEVVEACMTIIWEVRKRKKLAFWALENVGHGLLRQFLGKEALVFQPNEYGDAYTKKTSIWGYFKEPKKRPVRIDDRVKARLAVNNRILPPLPIGYREPNKRNDAARRAITPQGFAKAFLRANP